MAEPSEGGSAQSMVCPPLLTPDWQDLPCQGSQRLQAPPVHDQRCYKTLPRTLPALCMCVRVRVQPLAVRVSPCVHRHWAQAPGGTPGSLRTRRRRPGPSLAVGGACGGRQPPPAGVLGRAPPRPAPSGASLMGWASGRAHGRWGLTGRPSVPFRLGAWGRGAGHCVPGPQLLAPPPASDAEASSPAAQPLAAAGRLCPGSALPLLPGAEAPCQGRDQSPIVIQAPGGQQAEGAGSVRWGGGAWATGCHVGMGHALCPARGSRSAWDVRGQVSAHSEMEEAEGNPVREQEVWEDSSASHPRVQSEGLRVWGAGTPGPSHRPLVWLWLSKCQVLPPK